MGVSSGSGGGSEEGRVREDWIISLGSAGSLEWVGSAGGWV